MLFKKNIFGQYRILKRLLITALGIITWPRFTITNSSRITGMKYLQDLPGKGVLFVSNHQTYFADVALMYHVFSSAKWGFKKGIRNPVYLLSPKMRVFYVAAKETMKSGILPRLFTYGGAISVQRTWKKEGKSVKLNVDTSDTEKIGKALSDNWVITFPQGTTTPFEKGRRGTAHIIKQFKPLVVPVTINGFRRAFDKKGLKIKKRNTQLEMDIQKPLDIDYNASVDEIIDILMDAIKQSSEYLKVAPPGQFAGRVEDK